MRLYSRPGNDMTRRFPLIAEALTGLRSRSCIIDGEAVACDDNGVASFNLVRYRRAKRPSTFRAACQRWPGTSITLRHGARVIEDSRRLRVV